MNPKMVGFLRLRSLGFSGFRVEEFRVRVQGLGLRV